MGTPKPALSGSGKAASRSPSIGRVAVLVGTLVALTVIGSSAVAVALPAVAAEFALDTSGTAWILATFSLTFAITTAVFGRLSDLYGLRKPLYGGVALMAAGSALAAAAWSYPVLVTGRLLQGAGAGAIPVLALGIVTARFDGETRDRAVGGLTAMVAIVSGSGPLIGGSLATVASWRAVVAVPVLGLLLVVPVARLAPDDQREAGRLDARGAVLVALTVTGVVLLLQSPSIGAGLAVAGGAGLLALGAGLGLGHHTRDRPEGFLPRVVVRNRVVVLSAVAGLTLLGAYLGLLLAAPLLLSRGLGWTPLRIGLALLPAAVCGAVSAQVLGALGERVDRYRIAAVVSGCSAAGLLLAAAAPRTPVLLVAGLALVAVGFAGGQAVLVAGVPQVVEPSVRGIALGVFNLVFFTGGAVGSAAVGGLGDVLGLPGALAAVALLPLAGVVAAVAAGRACVQMATRSASAGER